MRYRTAKLTKHELLFAKHYCYRYAEMCEQRTNLYYAIKSPTFDSAATPTSKKHSYVEDCAIKSAQLSSNIERIENSVSLAIKNDPVLYPYILQGVTDEFATFNFLAQKGLPCCRNTYYTIVRKVYANIVNSII